MRPFPSAMFPGKDALLSMAPNLMPQAAIPMGIGKIMTYPAPAYKATPPMQQTTDLTMTTTANQDESAAAPSWLYVAMGVAIVVGVVLLIEYNR